MTWLPSWNIQPGLYAMCAATAMLGGVFRASISLVVLLVEGTQVDCSDKTALSPAAFCMLETKCCRFWAFGYDNCLWPLGQYRRRQTLESSIWLYQHALDLNITCSCKRF